MREYKIMCEWPNGKRAQVGYALMNRNKMIKMFDGYLNGAKRLPSIGELPDDPVVAHSKAR